MSVTATVGARRFAIRSGETLLEAADRQGVPFPSGCRVGGCGACKCRVVRGQVRERLDSSYLLGADELRAGWVLGCQSEPLGDVEVALPEDAIAQVVREGRIGRQRALSPEIAAVDVHIDGAMRYRPGQSVQLTLDGVTRSYSMASAASLPAANGEQVLTLWVRRVEGGQLSPRLCDEHLSGQQVRIDGPHGEFWLRDGQMPLLMVAGGSGLAPIMAMLQDACARGDSRDVTLLLGVRRAAHIYAVDELQALAQQWRGRLRWHAVLSEEDDSSGRHCLRGMLADHVADFVTAGCQAYVCGPPPMIDTVQAALVDAGVAPADIRTDRFATAADRTDSAREAAAGLWHYLRYLLFHGLALLAMGGILAGAPYTALLLGAVVLAFVLGDALAGDDTSTPHFRHPQWLTWQLWLALPLMAGISVAAVWTVAPTDLLHLGATLGAWTGRDLLAARASAGAGHHVATWVLTGLMIGLVGTITAHELTHRTWDRVSMTVGRWLLAFSFDTAFAVEHVYGHHRYVSTSLDPATAPRGRSVYAHILLSTLRGNASAWHIERERLAKRGWSVWSLHNAVLRGYAMSLLLVVLAWLGGGWQGALFFVACGLWGKALLEIVNYMEHYGMVRVATEPVQPRHSWNTNRRVSSWSMFNLTRHSHHHAAGEVPFHALRPMPEAPQMVGGYLTTILLTLLPPLWHRLMTPRLLAWDRQYASAAERDLARQANRNSGIASLYRAAR